MFLNQEKAKAINISKIQNDPHHKKLICPNCRSEKIILADNGMAICLSCVHSFSPSDNPAETASKEPEKTEHPLKLFLSYGHTESEIAEKITEALIQRGHDVWFDKNNIKQGQDWRDRITAGLETTDEIISCLSKHSIRNPGVCLNELSIAIGIKGASIKTILLEKEEDLILPASLSHIQWLDMSEWKEEMAKGEESFSLWFDQKMAELFESLESKENVEFSGQLQKLEEKLVPIKSFPKQETLLKIPFTGREWLSEKIENWAQSSKDQEKIAMIFGDPGIGKSSFVTHFTHYNPLVAAAIFCDFSQESQNDPDVLIRTLAYQLAGRLPSYRRLLLSTIEKREDLFSLNSAELFNLLLSWPLSHSIDGEHEVQLIVIDGLDESSRSESNDLAKILKSQALTLPRWIKILATSRKESAVLSYLDSATHIDLERESRANRKDIHDFLVSQLADKAREEGLSEKEFDQAIEKLEENSQGIFLYASLMAQAFVDDSIDLEKRPALKDFDSFPKGLSEAFQSWFSWYFPDQREYLDDFQKPLGLIASSPEPIPEEELQKILALDEDKLHYFKQRLASLLTESTNFQGKKSLSFSHKFLQDWITSPKAYFFQASRNSALKKMLEKYLEVLERKGELSSFELRTIYPLVKEAGDTKQLDQILFHNDLTESLLVEISLLTKKNFRVQATSLVDQSIERLETALNKAKEKEEIKSDLARFYSLKAGLEKDNKNLAACAENDQKAIDLIESLEKDQQEKESRRFLSLLYNDQALSFMELMEIDKAYESYQKAISLRHALIKEFQDPIDEKELASMLSNIGFLYEKQSETKTALDFNLKALEILEKLEKEKQQNLQLDLATTNNNLAYLYLDLHEQSLALDYFQKALDILEQSSEQESESDELDEVLDYKAITLNNLAAFHTRRKELTQARSANEKALKIRKQLAKKSGLLKHQQYLADSYAQQALIYKEAGQIDLSLDSLQKSTKIWSDLAKKVDLPDYDLSLASSYANLAVLYRFKQDYRQALSFHQKALKIREDLYSQYDLPLYGEHLANGLDNLAFFCSDSNDFNQAVIYQNEAIEIWKSLVTDYDKPDYLYHLGKSLAFLAFLETSRSNKEKSFEEDLKACSCFERLVRKHKEKDYLYSLAQSYLSLGVSCFELGDYRRSLQFLNKNTRLLAPFVAQKEYRAIELLKASRDEMVNDCLAQNNFKKAQKYEKEARKLARLLDRLKNNPEN